jgi:hypothetical protein
MSGLLNFVLLLLGLQIALLLMLLYAVVDLGGFVGIHFVSCLALATWSIWRWKGDYNRSSAAVQIAAWSALAGPFGAFVAVALLLPAVPDHSAISGNDVDTSMTDRPRGEHAERMHTALLDHRVRVEGACQVRPLMDVIVEGTRSEKLDALAVVYRRYDARLSAVLKRALRDPDMPVRVQAATVTAKLNATFGRKVADYQTAAAAAPKVAASWRDTADARLAYAGSGLLEAPRARAEIDLAVSDLSRAIELDPANRSSRDLLERARQHLAAWRI